MGTSGGGGDRRYLLVIRAHKTKRGCYVLLCLLSRLSHLHAGALYVLEQTCLFMLFSSDASIHTTQNLYFSPYDTHLHTLTTQRSLYSESAAGYGVIGGLEHIRWGITIVIIFSPPLM